MLKFCILIAIVFIMDSSLAWGNMAPAANIIRSDIPVRVTIYYHNGGIGTETILAGGAININGDFEKLFVSPIETDASMKPVMCQGVYSNAIDISVKKGKEIECK